MAKTTPLLSPSAKPESELKTLVASALANAPLGAERRRVAYNSRWMETYNEVRPLLLEKGWSAMAVSMWLRQHDKIAENDVVRCKSALTRLHRLWKRRNDSTLRNAVQKSMI